MDDIRVGQAFRSVRLRRRLRQRDVGAAAGVSDVIVSRLERGHLTGMPLGTLRRIGGVLEIRVGLIARWRGGSYSPL